MKTLLGILFIISPLFGLFYQDNLNEDWLTFKEKNYEITYPKNWDVDQRGSMGTAFSLLSPLTSEKDAFKENVNLVVQDIGQYNLNLDKYVILSEEQVKKYISNSEVIESTRVKNGKYSFHKIIYTGEMSGYKLKFEQYYWVISNKAYVLTFTCEDILFDEYREVGEKIMNSFKFI